MANIIDLMTDKHLLGEHYQGDTWENWKALLTGFYGLKLEQDYLNRFNSLTSRKQAKYKAFNELWLVIGRRGAKSRMAALIAVYEAVFVNHKDKLSAGEVATVMCISADRKQSRTVMRYIQATVLKIKKIKLIFPAKVHYF